LLNPAGDVAPAGPAGVDPKKKPKTKVVSSYTHKDDANYLQAPREKDIPAANIALGPCYSLEITDPTSMNQPNES